KLARRIESAAAQLTNIFLFQCVQCDPIRHVAGRASQFGTDAKQTLLNEIAEDHLRRKVGTEIAWLDKKPSVIRKTCLRVVRVLLSYKFKCGLFGEGVSRTVGLEQAPNARNFKHASPIHTAEPRNQLPSDQPATARRTRSTPARRADPRCVGRHHRIIGPMLRDV